MTTPITKNLSRSGAPGFVVGQIKASYPRLLRILVPLDFSGKSRQALRYAIPLAQKFSARIHLVHVLPVPTKAKRAELPRLKRAALERLGLMSVQLLPPRLRAGSAVLVGAPAAQILALAEKNAIDLIVLTPKGRTGLKRVLLGSTAEKVMHHARCPVLSVRRT